MTSIGIIGTHPSFYSDLDDDRDSPALVRALAGRGARAQRVNWHDETVDWSSFDLLVLRSPWDYMEHLEKFEAWLERAGAATRILNSPALVRWNMDKRYLAQLEAAGIPGVPTSYHVEEAALALALAAVPAEVAHVVVKPSVSAGSRLTGLFEREDRAAHALGRRILAEGGTVMLQPEVPELTAGAEKALYLIDGRFTHAIAKGALLARGGGLLGGAYEERPQVVGTTDAERGFAADVLRAVADATGEGIPLYARIDVVDSAAHGLVLLEAELFEPTFNLHLAPEVVESFTTAILDRV